LLTVCVGVPPNAVTQTTNNSTPTFNLITTDAGGLSGTGFLGVLVPNTTAATPSFTVTGGTFEESKTVSSGQLGDAANLNEPGMTDYTIQGSLKSASAQVGVTANSFQAYEFNLGTYNSAGNGAAGISGLIAGPLPVGTVLLAWVENTAFTVIAQTPLSESLTVGTAVPEPGTLALFGSGLVSLGMVLR